MILIFYLVLFIVIIFFYRLYISLTKNNDYWKKKNVPYLKPRLLFGNFSDYILFKKSAPTVTSEICEQFPDEPYVGVFYGTAPALVIKDPKLLKLVLAQDFSYFNGRENTDYANREAVTTSIFFTGGDHWKVLRHNLTPLFTSAKLKNMFPTIAECAEEMTTFLEEEKKISENSNLKSLLARYSMDCIINCIFGLRANTLKTDNGVNPFVIVGEKIFDTSTMRSLKIITRAMWPSLFYALGFKLFDEKIEVFFKSLFIGARKNRLKEKSSMKNFVDLILSWEEESYITGDSFNNSNISENNIERLEVNEDLLVAQCTSFFGAGFETTSSTINFLLYELSKSKRAQDIVLEEVDAYFKKHGYIKYECLNEMPYLEACIDETLRLYPTLGSVTREVMKCYTLPTGLRLQKGDRVHIPVHYIHRHPDYFPDPISYRPERFFGDEKKKIKQFTFMPFGDGPRVCIGARFSKMVMYAGLLTIFRKYRIELGENMPLSLKLRPVSIVTQISTNLQVKFIPREL
ncbi:cytochrome P450 6B2-like [Vanessa tameamea]|uniref:unspecific monooxygenase n=1 Tax=Vanessa tameamea TaxID=334116 RepID=A0A8B8HVI6_VANTA